MATVPFAVEARPLPGVAVLLPRIFPDERGFFLEVFRADLFPDLSLPEHFLQENHSGSKRGVLRGLHFQWQPPMGKLMRVTSGVAFLVAVDIRKGSPTLGQWFGLQVSAENRKMVWAPAGFARGFCALSKFAEVQYLCTAVYNPQGESAIRWDDSEIAIRWPLRAPILSPKDAQAQFLRDWLQRPEAATFTFS